MTNTSTTTRGFWMPTLLTAACLATTAMSAEPEGAKPFADQTQITAFEEIRLDSRRYGLQDAPAVQEGSFRLTTYNIENLFDTHDDPELAGKNDDAGEDKPVHELIATAMAIHAVNADVLCVQEIESEQALLEYRDLYLADMGYDYVVSIDAGNARGIENAVLSRFPISNYENWPNKPLGGVHPEKYGRSKNWYAGEPIAFRRSPLMIDLEIPAAESSWTLTLFNMHHKSGHFNTYWREAEAKGTIEIINSVLKEHPNRPIVILGDFNAENNAESVQLYLDAGFVDIFEDRKSHSEIMTHESRRRIDLILANPAALKHMNASGAFVYGTAARPDGVDYRDLDTFEGYAADHYPVSVDMTHAID